MRSLLCLFIVVNLLYIESVLCGIFYFKKVVKWCKYFKNTIKAQHVRNATNRQQCLNKSALDMLLSKKTQPEETIFQIGNKNFCPISAEQLWDIYKDYQRLHNAKFGKHIKILDAALHSDETTLHIRERKVFLGVNSHTEVYPAKDSALELLGIERPNTNKKKDRFNNRKQTYTAECRKIWIHICRQHGINLETEPQIYSDKKGLEITEYKVAQEMNKLQSIENELTKINTVKERVQEDIKQQGVEVKKNNSLLRSQISTIQSNKKILKQQEQQKNN